MREFLGRFGRAWLLRPIYEALAENGEDRDLANEIFAEMRPRYHPLTIAAIAPALQADEKR